MRKRKQRQEKLHDSLINTLYAPPSPPPNHNQFDEQTLNLALEIVNSDHHHINTDELTGDEERGLTASSEEDDGELGFQKLTRAQRKRLRKKKLKGASSERRQIIGPELPDQSEGVRRNAAQRPESGNEYNHRGETPSCIKVKHRRMSKKKAMENPKISSTDLSHDDQI